MKATQEAGGDVPAVLAKFREAHAKELEAQEAAEQARQDVPSLEREQMRQKASERVQKIHEIQEQLKAGKDPNEILPPE